MDLGTYLSAKGQSDTDFAVEIGVSRSMVTKLRLGQAKPSADTALRIERATRQSVLLQDLLPALPALPASSEQAEQAE